MSRIGKLPVAIPSGVKAAFNAGVLQVEGPKGKLSFTPGRGVGYTIADGKVTVNVHGSLDDKQVKANYGTARSIANNMMVGVTKGWQRSLEMNGVGFTAKAQGQKIILACGFSHDVIVDVPKDVKFVINKNVIELESADKNLVGTLASNIRKVQPPEPYLGKGIKYSEEKVRRKAGKTGKK